MMHTIPWRYQGIAPAAFVSSAGMPFFGIVEACQVSIDWSLPKAEANNPSAFTGSMRSVNTLPASGPPEHRPVKGRFGDGREALARCKVASFDAPSDWRPP